MRVRHLSFVLFSSFLLLVSWPSLAAYTPTAAEVARGYWVTIGSDGQQQPLPLTGTLSVDLPLSEQRSLYVGVVPLRALSGSTIQVQVSGSIASMVSVAREVRTTQRLSPGNEWSKYTAPGNPLSSGSEDSIIFAPFTTSITRTLDTTPIPLSPHDASTRPAEYRLWLRFASNATAGTYSGTLTINVHGASASIPLTMTVWPVQLPAARPFDVYGYGDIATYAINYTIDAQNTAALTAKLDAYAAAGGNVLAFASGSLSEIATKLKWGPQKASLPVPSSVPLDALPELDFSYFDPWFELARTKVKRIETYLNLIPGTKTDIADPLVGANRVAPGSAEEKLVVRWWLGQLRAYLVSKGFTEPNDFFCKISDEIGPEHIDAYNVTAEVARQGGWRPYTTIMGTTSRSSEMLVSLAPHVDQWQMGYSARDTFRRLSTEKYRLEWKELTHHSGWQQYINGGALDTWGRGAIYGTNANGQPYAPRVDRTMVLQDVAGGVPLRLRPGQSPWANRDLNVAYILGTSVYAARADGLGPAGTTLTARYRSNGTWFTPSLTYQGQYTNAGAQDTGLWTLGATPPEPYSILQQLSAAGAPLAFAGQYPWGNRKRGVFYRWGSDPYVYVSPIDGRAPGNLFTVRYAKLDANGNRVWADAPLTNLYGQYGNGGAMETWLYGLPAAAAASDVEQLLILQNVSAAGLPLELLGASPWGNTRTGVAFVHGQAAWVAPRDGRTPSTSTFTVRWNERIPDAVNGSVLVTPEADDEVWFYGGYEHTFAMPYELMVRSPLLAAIEKPHGYATFAFQWWNDNRIVWTDGAAATLTSGPAYAGMRDGWRDAILIDYAVRTRGVMTVAEVPLPLAALPVPDDEGETYTEVADSNQQTLNAMRRAVLQRLSQ
jgi:hypothetical protein